MNERELEIFINCIRLYFDQFKEDEVEFGPPYIADLDGAASIMLDFTGSVTITGHYRGALAVTADRALLENLIRFILKKNAVSEIEVIDIAAELANALAGYARREYGKNFALTVPVTCSKKSELAMMQLVAPITIVPFKWMGGKARAYIGIVHEEG